MKNIINVPKRHSLHSAFTMVELVFVIVILGILSAVAIPKLSAVKDDAYLATAIQSYCSDAMKSKLNMVYELQGTIGGEDIGSYFNLNAAIWTSTPLVASPVSYGGGALTPQLSNTKHSVYVYYVDANESAPVGCFVSNVGTGLTGVDAQTAFKKRKSTL